MKYRVDRVVGRVCIYIVAVIRVWRGLVVHGGYRKAGGWRVQGDGLKTTVDLYTRESRCAVSV